MLHLREHSGHLYAGGSAAYDDYVEQLLLLQLGGAGYGALEVGQDGVLQSHGLRHCFHRHGLALDVLVAVEVGGSTGGKHQVVVVHLADGRLYQFLVRIDGAQLGHAEVHVLAVLENLAEGERYGAGLHSGRGHLVDERRELVVVVPVDKYNLES